MTRTMVATEDPDEPGSSKDEELFERRVRAVFMRNAGGTYSKIGTELGISTSQARKDVEAGLREFMKESAEAMIARQRSIIHDIVRANYAKMMAAENSSDRIDAGRLVLGALEREAKLFGLDAPARVSLGVNDYEYAERMAGLISALGLTPPAELLAGLRRDVEISSAGGDPPLDAEVVGAAPDAEESMLPNSEIEPAADGDARTPDEKHAFDSQMGADGVVTVVTVVDDPGTLPVGDPPPTDLADLVDPPDAGPADDGWSNI